MQALLKVCECVREQNMPLLACIIRSLMCGRGERRLSVYGGDRNTNAVLLWHRSTVSMNEH